MRNDPLADSIAARHKATKPAPRPASTVNKDDAIFAALGDVIEHTTKSLQAKFKLDLEEAISDLKDPTPSGQTDAIFKSITAKRIEADVRSLESYVTQFNHHKARPVDGEKHLPSTIAGVLK